VNTDGLAKLYGRLTPRERLPLIVAAAARGDEQEQQRLARSAPTCHYRVPDYHSLGDAFSRLLLFHLADATDRAARFWRALALMAAVHQAGAGPKEAAASDQLLAQARLLAYLLTVGRDAWRAVCGEWGIDGEFLLRDLPGYDTVEHAEPLARKLACSAGEAEALLRQTDPAAEVLTVSGQVALLRQMLAKLSDW